jgi:hypothetical protein
VHHDPTQALGVATKQYVDAVVFIEPLDHKLYARRGGATPEWVITDTSILIDRASGDVVISHDPTQALGVDWDGGVCCAMRNGNCAMR